MSKFYDIFLSDLQGSLRGKQIRLFIDDQSCHHDFFIDFLQFIYFTNEFMNVYFSLN